MATTTPRLGLPRPEASDNVTLENEQALIDAIDSAAAAQADLDAHVGNASAHVTASERAAWNAKETPAGAQEKVDTHANRTDNPHSVTKSQVGLGNVDNVQQAPASRTITAGNGLSGGGDLTANRTISLGTPGTLSTSSTNSTTAASHTHAVNFPVTSVAGKTGAVSLVKDDVGLGNVQNYSIATQAAAEAGTSNNVYMTPLRTRQAIASAGTPLDYEEGVWTPRFAGSISDGSHAYSLQVGRYIKIGRMVHCQFQLTLSNKGDSVGASFVRGLPFSSGSNFGIVGTVRIVNADLGSGYYAVGLTVNSHAVTILLRKRGQTEDITIEASGNLITNSTSITGSITYFVN
ncbi:hypothetical protein DUZ99_08750 [Xylanibacillus composti]|uniref:Tail fiber-like repeat protein n=1 Tax=Xylanibacillus composti TaxID=1572762 RepID=A0A8J4H8B4_9BACL|nr:hypothetical protein [Xylanibacillus composti]MDT9725084.1 hypothetical protein [Xylanibacillus composti]GIQ70899.1 hypothetical protein XYCOK13_37230 [Xylanibacillus composti]